jgi:hypothetical protein
MTGVAESGRVRLIDVSDLAPPQPFEQAVAALSSLAEGEALCLRHRREPRLLYPVLAEQGFLQVTRAVREGEVLVVIWRDGDEAAERAARAALAG